MVYNAANSQQSNTYQYPTDKKVRKLFEVPTYYASLDEFCAFYFVNVVQYDERDMLLNKI